MSQESPLLSTEHGRRRAVRFALALTHNTHLAPQRFEEELLDQFVRGELSIEQVLTHLEESASSEDDQGARNAAAQ
ncbi:hypothetical protein [Hymenobacter sp. B1770]|uniref:hypothetical protein n=1 Tax=Hymenobacter sp. B1770 TaxID=1718788 RepID=UPI003CF4B6E0